MRPGIQRHGTHHTLLAVCMLIVFSTMPSAHGNEIAAPRIVAELDDGTNPVKLVSYHAEVEIHGFLSRTSVTLSFENRHSRILGGELEFALPEGATVTGYALDIGEVMVEAVAVPKEVARIAFETEARASVDPGIVEWVDGSFFRTLVYPIRSNSRRHVRIEYVNRIERRAGSSVYTLPLAGLPELETLDVDVRICGSTLPPRWTGDSGSLQTLEIDGVCSKGSGSFSGSAPAGDLEISVGIPIPFASQTDVLEDGSAIFVAEVAVPENLGERRRRKKPKRLQIFWDASASRRDADHDAAIDAVSVLIGHWRPKEVALTVFRDQPAEPMYFKPRKGSSPDLLDFLSDLDYDGASRIDVLRPDDRFDPDTILLVFDGRSTMGSPVMPDFGAPVHTLSVSPMDHRAVLRSLADSNGGDYLDLTVLDADALIEALSWSSPSLIEVEVIDGSVDELSAPVGKPIDRVSLVTGRLQSRNARLRLHYGFPGRSKRSIDCTIERQPGAGLERRFWAVQRLADLTLNPVANRSAILRLGLEHGLVTPYTSLIVLETSDQYIRYRIEPPESLPGFREEFFDQTSKEFGWLADDRQDYLDELRSDWVEQEKPRYSYIQSEYIQSPNPTPTPSPPPPPSEAFSPTAGNPTAHPDPVSPTTTPTPTPSPVRTPPPDSPIELVHGSICGRTYGIDNFVMPGVMVMITSYGSDRADQLVTGDGGGFCSPELPWGLYHLDFAMLGHNSEALVFSHHSDRPEAVVVYLTPRMFAGEIQVSAKIPVVDTSQVNTSVTFDGMNATGSANSRIGEFGGVAPWIPGKPYLNRLIDTPEPDRYRAYLDLREDHRNNPGFYVDCARYFLESGRVDVGFRVLSNLLEMRTGEPVLVRVAAMLYLEYGDHDSAVELTNRLVEMRPEVPQSFRDLGVAYASRGWATLDSRPSASRADLERAAALFRQVSFEPWGPIPEHLQAIYLDEERFPDLGLISLVDLNSLNARFVSVFGKAPSTLRDIDSTFLRPVEADLRIVAAWDDEFADVDLWVTEPSGFKVSYENRRSPSGGVISEDFVEGLGPEFYLIEDAPPGEYQVDIHFWGEFGPKLVGPVTVMLQITTNLGRENEHTVFRSARLEDEDERISVAKVTIGP